MVSSTIMAVSKKPRLRLRDVALCRLLSVVFVTLCGVLLLIFLLASNSTPIGTHDMIDNADAYHHDMKFEKLHDLPQQNDLSLRLERLNGLPPRNLDLYPTLAKDRIVVVLYVHNRPQYLKVVVESLSQVVGISETLLIVSHDGYIEEMNKIIDGIKFCQVIRLYQSLNEGNTDEAEQFFKTLYSFVYLQGTYLKPHVAILDGITMGCGSGISLPGMFRVVTDKTIFSHPETQIGFHPDAGASYILSRLPGYLGEYLALTGDKLNGVEMIACRLATHYSLNARLALLEERLGKLITDEPSVVEASLAQYGDLVYPDRSSVLHRIDTIDRCFSQETVEEIIEALGKEATESCDEWCLNTLRRIREASPLSLKVTLQSIREGRFETLDKCLIREYRMSLRGISKLVSSDFFEGVRARMVDKDFAPKWDPPSLKDISEDMIEYYFSPLSEVQSELVLPTALREPYM